MYMHSLVNKLKKHEQEKAKKKPGMSVNINDGSVTALTPPLDAKPQTSAENKTVKTKDYYHVQNGSTSLEIQKHNLTDADIKIRQGRNVWNISVKNDDSTVHITSDSTTPSSNPTPSPKW